MKKLIRLLKKLFHVHNFNKPIVSQFWDKENRNIVYECACGKRKLFRVHGNYYGEGLDWWPIETTENLSTEDLQKYLNKEL